MSVKDSKKWIGIRAIHKASDSIQNIQTEMIIELLKSGSLNGKAISEMYEIASDKESIVPFNAQ